MAYTFFLLFYTKKYRFGGLYRQINRISLADAWFDLNKRAASGVDGITAREYKKNLADNLIQLETSTLPGKFLQKTLCMTLRKALQECAGGVRRALPID